MNPDEWTHGAALADSAGQVHGIRKADNMRETSAIEARLRAAATVADTLAAGFDAFEIIRLLARDCEDRVPGLLAAFMTAADAAVDGREAITAAPALPPPGRPGAGAGVPGASPDVAEIAGALAALGALLRDCLSRAAALATRPGDQDACNDAAQAAGRICQLMARDDDDARLR